MDADHNIGNMFMWAGRRWNETFVQASIKRLLKMAVWTNSKMSPNLLQIILVLIQSFNEALCSFCVIDHFYKHKKYMNI